MRTTFIQQLVEEARKNDRIFLLVGDLGYNVIEPFANEFPTRYINVGIAEQNMAGIAGGLAMNGWIVYCYSIGNFPTLRCIEQIRNDIVYYNSNVRIVSVGAGYAYGSQGVSHQATEDVGMLRTLPGMMICSPSDPAETKMLVKLSVNYQGPVYIRLGKAGEKTFHQNDIENYKIGSLLPLIQNKSSDTVVLTSGSIVSRVMDDINNRSLPYDVFTVPVVKPLLKESLLSIAHHYKQIIVLEENQLSAGVGSAIIEQLSDSFNAGELDGYPKIKRIAIKDEFLGLAGSQKCLQNLANLHL